MSLAIKYETVEDAQMRLRHTVVLYKGRPVYITAIGMGTGDEIFRVHYKELPLVSPERPRRIMDEEGEEGDGKRKYISSKHFDIAPFRMGYVNRPSGGGAFYCSRMPNRMQKQGLCGENFRAFDNFGRQLDFNTFVSCKETVAMVENNYPSFDVALKSLDKIASVAFNRDFALAKDPVIPDLVFLYHKGEKVGMIAPKTREVTLGDKFKCLKESLQEIELKAA